MSHTLFKKDSKGIIWNNNAKAIQRMLDYDYLCKRKSPSIAAIIHTTSSSKFQKFFFGNEEVLIPIYSDPEEAYKQHTDCDVLLNYASFRSAYHATQTALKQDNIKTIMITAEGIPERLTRQLIQQAKDAKKTIIGPATIGAITPGAFKTGNIGGTINNIIKTKLYAPGSAGLVTRSGGLFNELVNIISLQFDGIAEGVAIGGDRYPGTLYLEHLLRMEKNPEINYMILLGEVGGTAEYEVIEAIKNKQLTKPIIGWCIGTVSEHFSGNVQFGHAGAMSNSNKEQAHYKNEEMKKAGILVPDSFNELPKLIREVSRQFTKKEVLTTDQDINLPQVPKDFKEAKATGAIRKETNFICTISDDRGEEAVYAGLPISSIATPETGYSIADVISLLWFKKRYPKWASDFLETVIKTVADHGPAVSGAHNARVTARAGKDLISALSSGLLTIGPKFGGAIDGAAKFFKDAQSKNQTPINFVNEMKEKSINIPGIGHRIKSKQNPDLRVTSLIEYAQKNFPSHKCLDFALGVEEVTTSKKENLILNVDGTIGALLVDMWISLNYSNEEIDKFIETGTLNAFFVLGRTIGFIGHILDEKRLNMPLYRHQFDDILYDVQTAETIK